MSPLKTVTFAATVAVILTSGWQYQSRQARLEEAARLRAENGQLRLQASSRMRGQPETLQAPSPAGTSTNVASGQGDRLKKTELERAVTGLRAPEPASDYRNEGMATPLNTLQTLAWACDSGDMALMEKLLIYDGDAREKAVRHFEAHPTDMPAEWASLEAAAAALYVVDGMKHPYPAARVLELAKFEPLRPGRVRLHLPDANGDGYEFQQTAEGWKLAVTMVIVDDYIRQASQNRENR